jgi:small subunit ribosomal protein S15
MRLEAQTKQEILNAHGENATDTGKAEVQIALFTHRIAHLTEHLKGQKKDKGTQRSLIAMVGKRRALLDYLKAKDITRYRAILEKLNLRK